MQKQCVSITKKDQTWNTRNLNVTSYPLPVGEKNAALYNVRKVWNFLIRQEKNVCSHWPRKLCVLVLAHHQEILSCLLQSWTLTCLQRWSCLPALLTTVFQASSSRNTRSQAALPPFLSSFSEPGLPLRPLCVCCREDPTRLSPTFCALGHPLFFKGGKVKKFLPRTLPILMLPGLEFGAFLWVLPHGPTHSLPWFGEALFTGEICCLTNFIWVKPCIIYCFCFCLWLL